MSVGYSEAEMSELLVNMYEPLASPLLEGQDTCHLEDFHFLAAV